MSTESKYLEQEGYDFMGAAFEVYNELGSGLTEEIYQECLEIELCSQSIPFQSQVRLAVWYKEQKISRCYIPDLIVQNQILVELKAVKELSKEHEKQLFNYLHITKKPLGYLINFASPGKLQWKRFLINTYIPAG